MTETVDIATAPAPRTGRRTPRLEFRRNDNGQWYWRFLSGNGTELARSSKSYRRKIDAKDCATTVLGQDPDQVHHDYPDPVEAPFVVKEIGNYGTPAKVVDPPVPPYQPFA